jgi:hypothetical protein
MDLPLGRLHCEFIMYDLRPHLADSWLLWNHLRLFFLVIRRHRDAVTPQPAHFVSGCDSHGVLIIDATTTSSMNKIHCHYCLSVNELIIDGVEISTQASQRIESGYIGAAIEVKRFFGSECTSHLYARKRFGEIPRRRSHS